MRVLAAVLVALITCGGCQLFGPGGTPRPTQTPTIASARPAGSGDAARFELAEFPVTSGAHPHDVAPATDGGVWYTGQANGTLGHLDPKTGEVREVTLGDGSAPHGVILGPDGAPWITDSGLNAIVRVDPATEKVDTFPLPANRGGANLNTATFDRDGVLWFTGQSGIYGRLHPKEGRVEVFDAPGGQGPYGISSTPQGPVFYASLAGSHIGRIDPATRKATQLHPPTEGQGARRIWADSKGGLWFSEWNAGQVGRYDAGSGDWREWKLPGDGKPYAIYVDERDAVWVTDFAANAILFFDHENNTFDEFALRTPDAAVRQLNGRPGEVWGAESGADKLVVIRTR
jgi:virginiamycin B lyase